MRDVYDPSVHREQQSSPCHCEASSKPWQSDTLWTGDCHVAIAPRNDRDMLFTRRYRPFLLPHAPSLQKSTGLFAFRSRPRNDKEKEIASCNDIKLTSVIFS